MHNNENMWSWFGWHCGVQAERVSRRWGGRNGLQHSVRLHHELHLDRRGQVQPLLRLLQAQHLQVSDRVSSTALLWGTGLVCQLSLIYMWNCFSSLICMWNSFSDVFFNLFFECVDVWKLVCNIHAMYSAHSGDLLVVWEGVWGERLTGCSQTSTFQEKLLDLGHHCRNG